MFDRIDETFKYDRAKQEAVVQALLQAEGRVSLFERIGLVIFLRTDLFELYDIQEKNKLVSRTLTLDWSEEEWLQVLVRRVLANEPFQSACRRWPSRTALSKHALRSKCCFRRRLRDNLLIGGLSTHCVTETATSLPALPSFFFTYRAIFRPDRKTVSIHASALLG